YINTLHVRILEEPLSSNLMASNVQNSSPVSSDSKQSDVVGFQIWNLMGQIGRMRKTNL
ncbi:1407_t:CDS:1, partial [Acaulospora colombiana]